jgi:hypothetical protein
MVLREENAIERFETVNLAAAFPRKGHGFFSFINSRK